MKQKSGCVCRTAPIIIGANGRTGTQLIDLGLARGHELTAFVRATVLVAFTDALGIMIVAAILNGQAGVYLLCGVLGLALLGRKGEAEPAS